jgi:hypothetical protein
MFILDIELSQVMHALQNVIARSGTTKQSKQLEIASLTFAMTPLERKFKKACIIWDYFYVAFTKEIKELNKKFY